MFGRLIKVDKRDNLYPISAPSSTRKSRYWPDTKAFLNQQTTPHCVGYAWSHWLLNSPIVQYMNPDGIYMLAQHLDEWPGENYEGTSVRAGAKVLKSLGFISEYQWATSLDDAVDAVLEVGPIVVGINWYQNMMVVDGDGFIRRSGKLIGGHATLINGVDRENEKFRVKNSWGSGWGNNGRAWLSFADAAKLFDRTGEVCLPVESTPSF